MRSAGGSSAISTTVRSNAWWPWRCAWSRQGRDPGGRHLAGGGDGRAAHRRLRRGPWPCPRSPPRSSPRPAFALPSTPLPSGRRCRSPSTSPTGDTTRESRLRRISSSPRRSRTCSARVGDRGLGLGDRGAWPAHRDDPGRRRRWGRSRSGFGAARARRSLGGHRRQPRQESGRRWHDRPGGAATRDHERRGNDGLSTDRRREAGCRGAGSRGGHGLVGPGSPWSVPSPTHRRRAATRGSRRPTPSGRCSPSSPCSSWPRPRRRSSGAYDRGPRRRARRFLCPSVRVPGPRRQWHPADSGPIRCRGCGGLSDHLHVLAAPGAVEGISIWDVEGVLVDPCRADGQVSPLEPGPDALLTHLRSVDRLIVGEPAPVTIERSARRTHRSHGRRPGLALPR